MTPQALLLAVMLARVCVSEAGWTGHDECSVIVHALVQNAHQRDIPLESQICAYAPRSCDEDRDDGRRWIAHLHPNRRTPPPGWPRMPWEVYRARFTAMVLVAHRAYLGEMYPPEDCLGALHWGSTHCRACRHRMRRSRFVQLPCSGMANLWYGRIIRD